MMRRQPVERRGFALVAALLLMLLLSGIAVGTIYMVGTESTLGGHDMESNIAYYAAEAAMEKMMVDLGTLYVSRASPTVTEINALGATANHPVLPGVTYPEYVFNVPNVGGVPVSQVRNISAGPNEGLVAQIIPMTLQVTSHRAWGAEVKMTRNVEVALIPVFQFGIFSESDLSYFAGPAFDFGGRVHTNGSLFLATSNTTTGLVFHSKITVVREVLRKKMANGIDVIATGRDKDVWIPQAPNGCDGARPACRNLDESEGSKLVDLASADNPAWTNISKTIYNGMIVNGRTGAKALTLPFVASGLRNIEIIRRPATGESPLSAVGQSRLFNVAQVRVLLTDSAGELPSPGTPVRLANVGPYFDGTYYGSSATNTKFAEGRVASDIANPITGWVPPAGTPAGAYWPTIDGYLLVQARQSDGSYTDVTMEWLQLGIARGAADTATNSVHPDAILRFQSYRYHGDTGNQTEPDSAANRLVSTNFYPLGLYDTREGEIRDNSLGIGDPSCAINGVMGIIELDVNNLRRWLTGAIGTTGTNTESSSQNGYILYFSDRRGMLPDGAGNKISYGWEDNINPASSAGTLNGTLDPPEDVNENGTLEVYGRVNLGDAFFASAQGGDNANDSPVTRLDCRAARKNKVSGARHGLKLVNGALGNLPLTPAGTGGFTVASENIVYVQGHYNANSSGFGDPHAAAAVISDAVSLISSNWKDWHSFKYPTYRNNSAALCPATPCGARRALTSYFRLAIAAGKNRNWLHPSLASPSWSGAEDYGLDGGTHNFLRYLEHWGGQTFHYRGSIVSLYYSEYANGIYKCCNTVYSPPTRNFFFDTDFLDPSKLPPGTPKFRDMVNVGFQQIFTPY
jgi:hypothetical protein